MPCFSPLDGYRSRSVNESGKRSVVFDVHEGFHDRAVTVPCGQCIGCRLERSRQWAMRCVHEASLYEENAFITLTYDDAHLPRTGSLDKTAFPKFMKRLRKHACGERIRYYHAGEYGDSFGRPHYHALLFGYDFADKRTWSERSGLPVWRSATLERLWPMGQSEVGSVTFESAAYVARYCLKKINGKKSEEYYTVTLETGEVVQVQPEYATMSRRPGIGSKWYEDFKCEVYPADSVVVRGKLMKPPRFYDGQFEIEDPEAMAAVKRARKKAQDPEEQRSSRLLVRREVVEAQLRVKEAI